MAETSKIEWTDATWNPITGCTLVDDGCRNCYAAELAATRLKNHPSRKGLATRNAAGVAKFTGEVRFNEQWLDQPLRWSTPRMVFVCAHGDLFHHGVPEDWIDRLFAVMALCPHHTFQVLTKRPDRAREYIAEMADCPSEWRIKRLDYPTRLHRSWPLPNVWLGTSVSDQASANARIPDLLGAPAAVRFISAEPLLGPVRFNQIYREGISMTYVDNALTGFVSNGYGGTYREKLDWIIVGGESGRNARPMNPDWARAIRDQCQEAGTAFFFKQWGEWVPDDTPEARDARIHLDVEWHGFDGARGSWRVGKRKSGRTLDGLTWSQMPGHYEPQD